MSGKLGALKWSVPRQLVIAVSAAGVVSWGYAIGYPAIPIGLTVAAGVLILTDILIASKRR
jgi:hypothetical protein